MVPQTLRCIVRVDECHAVLSMKSFCVQHADVPAQDMLKAVVDADWTSSVSIVIKTVCPLKMI